MIIFYTYAQPLCERKRQALFYRTCYSYRRIIYQLFKTPRSWLKKIPNMNFNVLPYMDLWNTIWNASSSNLRGPSCSMNYSELLWRRQNLCRNVYLLSILPTRQFLPSLFFFYNRLRTKTRFWSFFSYIIFSIILKLLDSWGAFPICRSCSPGLVLSSNPSITQWGYKQESRNSSNMAVIWVKSTHHRQFDAERSTQLVMLLSIVQNRWLSLSWSSSKGGCDMSKMEHNSQSLWWPQNGTFIKAAFSNVLSSSSTITLI